MVDGVMLLVDASEGPLPQTRFVLRKALERRLPPIVVINKIDRPDARVAGSAERDLRPLHRSRRHRGPARLPGALHQRQGRHRVDVDGDARARTSGRCSTRSSSTCRRRAATSTAPLQILVANLDSSDYLGRIAIGRIFNGTRQGRRPDRRSASCDGTFNDTKVTKLFTFDGLKRVDVDRGRRRRHHLPRRHRGHHDRRDDRRRREPQGDADRSRSTSRRCR